MALGAVKKRMRPIQQARPSYSRALLQRIRRISNVLTCSNLFNAGTTIQRVREATRTMPAPLTSSLRPTLLQPHYGSPLPRTPPRGHRQHRAGKPPPRTPGPCSPALAAPEPPCAAQPRHPVPLEQPVVTSSSSGSGSSSGGGGGSGIRWRRRRQKRSGSSGPRGLGGHADRRPLDRR